MTKMRRQIQILLLVSFIAGCRKEHLEPSPAPDTTTTELKSGLPDKDDTFYGYFFTGYNYNRLPGYHEETITCFAEFCDPPKNLLKDVDRRNAFQVELSNFQGNVEMGVLHYNGASLDFLSGYYGLHEGSPSLIDQQVKWEVEGMKVVPGFTQNLMNEFPVYRDTSRQLQLHAMEGFTINLSEYFDRWDSVVSKVTSSNGYYNTYSVEKAGDGKNSVLIFSPKQLDFLPNSQGSLLVRTFRYFQRSIQGRRYVFELSTGVILPLKISR